MNILHNSISKMADYTFFNLNQLRVLDISNSAIVNLPVHVFHGLICLKEVYLQNNQLDYISPKIFDQLLTDNVIYIDIRSNYALTCKELCWLNYAVYKNPNQCLKLLNTVHCRHNNYSLPLAGPQNTICEYCCNTDQITFSVEVDEI